MRSDCHLGVRSMWTDLQLTLRKSQTVPRTSSCEPVCKHRHHAQVCKPQGYANTLHDIMCTSMHTWTQYATSSAQPDGRSSHNRSACRSCCLPSAVSALRKICEIAARVLLTHPGAEPAASLASYVTTCAAECCVLKL